jgi:hypothetical protein
MTPADHLKGPEHVQMRLDQRLKALHRKRRTPTRALANSRVILRCNYAGCGSRWRLEVRRIKQPHPGAENTKDGRER